MPLPYELIQAIVLICAISLAVWGGYRLRISRPSQSVIELNSLNELGRQLLRSQFDIDALCQMVYWQAGQIVPTGMFQLGLFEGDDYHVKVWVRDSERLAETTFHGGGTKGIVGWVRETGQPLLVRDFESERDSLPAFPQFDLDDPPRSGLFVPLIAGISTIGVMAIQGRQPARFTEENLRLLTILANQVAWAIRNAQLYERANHRAEQLKLLNEVTTKISSVQPLPGLLNQIVSLTKETFKYYCVSIFLKQDQSLKIGASTSGQFFREAPIIESGMGLIGWASSKARSAVANNVMEDKRYRFIETFAEAKSEVAIPLTVESRVLGVLDVQSDKTNSFNFEDVSLLETLASQIALAIEQATTYEAEHRLAERLTALVQVSKTVVSVLDLDELLERLVDLISDNFSFKRVHIFLRIGDGLVFRAGVGPHSVRWLIDELVYDLDDPGLIPKAARLAEPLLVDDVSQSSDYVAGPGLDDTCSELVVPIVMSGHVLGIIDLQSEVKSAFSNDDLTLMQSLADTVAVAIRNAALYLNERKRSNLAETLREIGGAIASDLDVDRVLAAILDGLSRVVQIDSAAILLAEEGASTLTIMATIGHHAEGILGQHLPVYELDTTNDIEAVQLITEAYHELVRISTDHICLTAPLKVSGQLIGYLIADRTASSQYSTNDEEIIRAFAGQASVAINNARLYSGQQSEAWVTTALLQVAEAVNAQVYVNESLETIARLTALLAGVTRCFILRFEPTDNTVRFGASFPVIRDSLANLRVLSSDHPFLDLLTVAERPIGAGHGYDLPMPNFLGDVMATSSVLGFPLRAKRELVGFLIVDDPLLGMSHDNRLMTILTGIAHQTATALEAADLQASVAERDRLEQELDLARQIQASFIPEVPPAESGWQMAAVWRAARQVSGDFYDFIKLPNGLWGLVIADVADKGMPAALFMAMCRTLLRAAAMSRTSPAETLLRVNELLFSDSRTDLFVTVFYAIWDPTTHLFKYACAGHNPPIHIAVGKRRKLQELGAKGIALGVLPNISLEEKSLYLKPHDIVFAYTDGVTEAMTINHEEWGMQRLRKVLQKGPVEIPAELASHVVGSVEKFVGDAPQSDDLTLWVLKRT